ncbi:helicase-related protein [Janibacter massiliensis]|uniref:helicase-related protein n=1 Tax=Janibacter massiliensis TaxID=2058291 RepID=UPI000D1068DB|nr:helicase-related protein [Janibacter massiliensis]
MSVTGSLAAGSLVRARGREWVVQPGSDDDFLVLQPLGGRAEDVTGLHTALEQVDPATFPLPSADDLGDARSARLLRTALRLGFRSTAGPFRCIGSIAVEPRAYQLVPLMLALRQPVTRLLIADDVGIGKTVEAGLIAAELLAQGSIERVAVLCSPALAEQWQQELREKFLLDATLVLTSTAARLERGLMMDESLFDRHPVTVVSTDFIKSPRRRDDFVQHAPDLVIVDEAHTAVMDADTTGRARHQRFELLTALAANPARHLLLVTATPHSGKEEGFRNLVGLLDPQLATIDLDTTAGRERLARHMVQRRRKDIRHFVQAGLQEQTVFPEDRETADRAYSLTPAYRDLFNRALAFAREQVTDTSGSAVHQRVRWWSALAMLRTLASSPAAAAETFRSRAASVQAEDLSTVDALSRSRVFDAADDEAVEGMDVSPGADPGTEAEGELSSASRERRTLRDLARRAEALRGPTEDAKLAVAVREVKRLLADGYNPIVFCRFIQTAEYVAEHLSNALGKGIVVGAVTGTLPPAERTERIAELTADPDKRLVLVATDCLSEGVNLQEHFQAVLHYDLAWNPTRHEQREGRVDRFGQRARTVRALTLYGPDTQIDGIVLDVLIRRHRAIRKATGVSVPVPDQNDSVLEALMEGLLLRGASGDQLLLDVDVSRADHDLETAWESAAAKEKDTRTKYQHAALKPEVVADEVNRMREAIGTGAEIEPFVRSVLVGLGGHITGDAEDRLEVATDTLDPALRDLLPRTGRHGSTFVRTAPAPSGAAALTRTDPTVAAVARHVLESALDASVPGERLARRAGIIRTTAVTGRTTLLLVRYRFHLDLPSREKGTRTLVAEDCELLAFRGAPSSAQWLDAAETSALAEARPDANIPPDQARQGIATMLDQLHHVEEHLTARADERAAELATSHARVREGAGEIIRALKVRAEHPVDVLGVYVYLPVVGATKGAGS